LGEALLADAWMHWVAAKQPETKAKELARLSRWLVMELKIAL
jgi:hypothetical protein